MDSLGCGGFFEKSGWHCQLINIGSGPATYISTPITLPGGKPLDFYLVSRGKHIEFTDDGITMFALRSMGYPLGDKRNWRSLENIAVKYGFSLSDSGAFEALFLEADLEVWGGKIMRLLSALADWEEARNSEGDTDFSLTQEVELLLRAKDPARKLERDVVVKIGRLEASFDFRWGETLVDAVSPVANAINARLRKALMINKSDEPVDVLFIVDDRDKQRKADEEISVLGDLSPTIRMTDFEKYYSPSVH